jgi:hypothetical protein
MRLRTYGRVAVWSHYCAIQTSSPNESAFSVAVHMLVLISYLDFYGLNFIACLKAKHFRFRRGNCKVTSTWFCPNTSRIYLSSRSTVRHTELAVCSPFFGIHAAPPRRGSLQSARPNGATTINEPLLTRLFSPFLLLCNTPFSSALRTSVRLDCVEQSYLPFHAKTE